MIKLLRNTNKIMLMSNNYLYSGNLGYDQALICSEVIKLIAQNIGKQQLLAKRKNISLKDQILQTIFKTSTHPMAQKNIAKIFQGGVNIDEQVWHWQQRIMKGSTIKFQQRNIYPFCPSNLITGQMFKIILQPMLVQRQRTLLCGYYGTSKTFSLLLYSILSDYIIKYKCDQIKKNPQFKINKSLLNLPKIIYLNVNLNEKDFPIQRLIRIQCRQIYISNENFPEIFKKQHSIDPPITKDDINLLKQIKIRYKRLGVKVILIIDQINQAASAFSQYRHYLDLKKQMGQKGYVKQKNEQIWKEILNQKLESFCQRNEDKIKKRFNMSKIILGYLSNNMYQYHNIFYLSSINIEKTLLPSMNKELFAGHEKMEQKQVHFTQKLFQRSAKYQIADYFIFQQEERFLLPSKQKFFHLPIGKEDIELKCNIREALVEIMEKNQYFFITPLSIRQTFKSQLLIQKSKKQIPTKSDLIDISKANFLICCQQSVQSLKQKINNFINQKNFADIERKSLILQLYYQAFYAQQKDNNIYYLKIQTSSQKWKEVKHKADLHLFKFTNVTGQLSCQLPPNLIVEILKPHLFQILSMSFQQIKPLLYKLSNKVKGCILQHSIIQVFIKSSPFIRIQNEASIKLIQLSDKVLAFNFLPIGKNNNNFKLLQNFKQFLKYIQKQKQLNYVFLPAKIQKQKIEEIWENGIKNHRIDTNSKCIDFAILGINRDLKHIEIDFYDIAISNTVDKIFQKIHQFLTQFVKLRDKNQSKGIFNGKVYNIDINYYVLTKNVPVINWKTKNKIQTLEKKSNFQLKFNPKERNSALLQVHDTNGQYSILKEIGVIDLQRQMRITPKRKNVQFEMSLINFLNSNEVVQLQ